MINSIGVDEDQLAAEVAGASARIRERADSAP